MSEKAKKIVFMIVVPAVLAAGLIGAIIWGVGRERERATLETTVTAMYTRAFTELTESMYQLETGLAKLTVAGSSRQTILLLDDVWRMSGVCVGLMSQIPSSHVDTASMNAFIIRAGDYARQLTKKTLAGQMLTADDAAQLDSMYAACSSMTRDLRTRLEGGNVPMEALSGDGYFTEGDYQSDESISEFPTLIYDGPFSDSAERAEPRGLSGDEVTIEDAVTAAEALFDGAKASDGTESMGVIPAYDFTLSLPDGRQADVSVTRTGGRILWLRMAASGDEEGVPDESVADGYTTAALDVLNSLGYESMTATYAQYYDGASLINFAATEGDVIIYNDLVKVWVDRATNEVIGVDARNYLFAHTERDIPAPAVTVEAAEGLVSDSLEIEDRALALIPADDGSEKLCWEFKGHRGDDAFIVYISAETGAEEQIFKIISDENGQLVI